MYIGKFLTSYITDYIATEYIIYMCAACGSRGIVGRRDNSRNMLHNLSEQHQRVGGSSGCFLAAPIRLPRECKLSSLVNIHSSVPLVAGQKISPSGKLASEQHRRCAGDGNLNPSKQSTVPWVSLACGRNCFCYF